MQLFGTEWWRQYLGLESVIAFHLKEKNNSLWIRKQFFYLYYCKYCKIDDKDDEIIQPSIVEALKWRRKSQKLTIEEKMYIYNQVKNGISIKEIKEICQLSQSIISRIVNNFGPNNSIVNGRSNIKSRYIQNSSLWR